MQHGRLSLSGWLKVPPLAVRARAVPAAWTPAARPPTTSHLLPSTPRPSLLPTLLRSAARRHYSHERDSHPFRPQTTTAALRWALLPVLLLGSSTLLLDSGSEATGLESITEMVEKPRENEFLIPEGAEDEGPPTRFWSIVSLVRDWVIEPLATARRFVLLALLFLPVIITAPILFLEAFDGSRDKRRGRARRDGERGTTRWWYSFLVQQMERGGPTFIKLAQWAGSRTDLFPRTLCILFGKLHSNGKPHSFKHTKRVIERAFGRPFSEIFDEFGETPMGIGAIAQVYKAVLNPSLLPDDYLGSPKHIDNPSPTSVIGRTLIPSSDDQRPPKVPSAAVAIKVLHPGVEKMISRDLKIMLFFAQVLNLFPGMEWLSFPEEVRVFGSMMMSQLDLRIEANNLETFEDKFRHRPTVSFPRALKSYTSSQVLIEEFEDAVPLEAFLREGGGAFDNRIANLGLDAFLNMLLIDNFVHSDLHPGNIMIKFFKPTTRSMLSSLWASLFNTPEPPSNSTSSTAIEIVHNLRALSHDRVAWLAELERLDDEGYQPEIIFIDTGLVTHLNDKNRKDFLDLFAAVAQFDGYKAGRLMVERCRAPELVVDDETFALRMQHLVLSVKSQTFSLAKIRIADILSDVLFNVRNHHVKLEADFVNTVISILLLEGIGRRLDPEMDLFKSAVPIMRQLGKQMSTTDIMQSGVDARGLGAMLKIWVWIEARQMATMATEEVDDMVRYDRLMPSI